MQLACLLATAESATDLACDLLGRVAKEDAAVGVRGRHLGRRAAQRGEEDAVDQCRLGQRQFRRIVAALPEVRILVDCTGDQAGDFGGLLAVWPEDEGEGGSKGGGGLHGGEVELGDVIARDSTLVCGRSMVN